MYLSILFISNPVLAANNRGENEGNLQTLQKVSTREGRRTVLSGYAVKRAIRDSMQSVGANLWRKTTDPTPENPVGYVYGENNSTFMAGAEPPAPTGYDDAVFGYMVATKGTEDNALKGIGSVEVSPGLSTTPYDGDQGFAQGLKAAEAQLNPFSFERHYTRYQFTVTFNLDKMADQPTAAPFILNALRSLRVGGSHSSNANELTPALLACRFHKEPGRGGLYLGLGLNAPPDEPVNLDALDAHCKNLGVEYEASGTEAFPTVDALLKSIEARVKEATC